MNLKPYAELMGMTPEERDVSLASSRVAEMKKKAEMEMARMNVEIISAETKIQKLSASYPIDFAAMLDAIDTKELLGRRKEQYAQIIDEMFPSKE